eukprot:7527910-Prorocentrum_lima.AAC.1
MPGMPLQIWLYQTTSSSHPPLRIEEVLPDATQEGWAHIPVPSTSLAAGPCADPSQHSPLSCLLYTSDAADDM